jgi:hypothetical protein
MAEQADVVTLKALEDMHERDLLEACEATFNIDIAQCEADYLHTVGDLYGVIRWKCQGEPPGQAAGSVADSYRALRAHLMARGVTRPIRPTGALETLLGPDLRVEWAQLRRRYGKTLPRLELSDGQQIVAAMLIALGLAGGIFGGFWVSDTTGHALLGVAAGLAVLGLMMLAVFAYGRIFARSLPVRVRTMADLARSVARCGEAPLRPAPQPPAPQPAAGLWEAFEDVLRRNSGVEGPVTADLALPKNAKAA